jgi:acyl-CoA dehydrogenase
MSLRGGAAMGLVDGPTEIHKFTIAKQVLKDYRPHQDGWPSQFKPRQLVAARHRFEEMIQERFDDPDTRAAFGPMLQRSEVPDDMLKEMEAYLDAILGANL